jgi:hypothetical protein
MTPSGTRLRVIPGTKLSIFKSAARIAVFSDSADWRVSLSVCGEGFRVKG